MAEPVWSVPRRIAFRFGALVGVLLLYPLPFGLLPGMEWLQEIMLAPWDWLVPRFAETVLGLEPPRRVMTGSGDTLYHWVHALLVVILAALGALAWSIADRHRRAYPRLQAAALVGLRYFLAGTMLIYGLAKVVENGQFPSPWIGRYDQTYGESSPMGLLWTFMGHSQAYTMFVGIAEIAGGVMLLWRRTTVIGALVVAAVMTNVVMLNFCYDVPVKLFSSQLLLCAILILLPHARRVTAALLGRAVGEVPPRTRSSRRVERARLVAKLAFVACIVHAGYTQLAMNHAYDGVPSELHGIWVVETFHADGVEHPPLTTDWQRWRKLIVGPHRVVVRRMNDERDVFAGAKVDPVARTLTLEPKTVLRYTFTGRTHLVIEGAMEDKQLRVTLVLHAAPLLPTRGFHWVQEEPFNR